MDGTRQIDGIPNTDLWKLMDRVEQSINGINSKASILFYLNGFLLTNLALQWPKFQAGLQGKGHSLGISGTLAVIAMAISVLGASLSLWASYSAILPGNISHRNLPKRLSLVFFAHIAARSPEEYRSALDACDEETLREDLVRQIHSLSVVVHRKQMLMRGAVQSAMILSIPSLIVLLAVYLGRVG